MGDVVQRRKGCIWYGAKPPRTILINKICLRELSDCMWAKTVNDTGKKRKGRHFDELFLPAGN